MPLARERLEVLQVRKLTQCVRTEDKAQIAKLVEHGIPGLINYQGEQPQSHFSCAGPRLLRVLVAADTFAANYTYLY